MEPQERTVLGSRSVIAFIPTTNPSKARRFYENVLGLTFVSDDQFALVFDADGTMLRVVNVSTIKGFKPAPFTILGWNVPKIETVITGLVKKGVAFQRYDGMEQDSLGVWTSPSGAKIAWFHDPDGNVLSLTE